jgi:Ca2+-binding RTX toxin-like protein
VTLSLLEGTASGADGVDTLEALEGLTGSAFADGLTGDVGNNTLDGGLGADTLVGGAGDDVYVVDNAEDVVTELTGEGTDLVQSSVAFVLSDGLENLTLTGTASIAGTGNAADNVLTGNSGNNTLDGGLGADTMAGGKGDDVYVVDDTADSITETRAEGTDTVQSSVAFVLGTNVENLYLTGSEAINGSGNNLANVMTGNAASNVLNGGAGNDSLTGGSGADQFAFSTSLNGASNLDTLTDFQTGVDTIVLSEAVFAQLAGLDIGASPSAENLVIGTAALDANDYLIYNSSTGVLSYDADGSGTASAAVAFAKVELSGVPPADLSATDFIVSA